MNLTFDLAEPFLTLQESEERVLAKVNLKDFTTKEINFLFHIKM